MVFKKSDLGFFFISVGCLCLRIKPSNLSANVMFLQQALSESLTLGSLILRKVRISSMACLCCISIVVSKYCMNLISQVPGGPCS